MKNGWQAFVLIIIVVVGVYAYENHGVSVINYVAYHNEHKDLETMVANLRRTRPNIWIFMQLGLMANEKVNIVTDLPGYGFVAHYVIHEPNQPLYELLCFADDDTPAFPQNQGAPIKVPVAQRGYYQQVCNERAESVMQFIRQKENGQ